MRFLLILFCVGTAVAATPALAWEFITTGPMDETTVSGYEHRLGEQTLSNYFGMDRNRANALNDAVLPHFGVHRIDGGERGDRPCFVDFHFVSFTGEPPPSNQLIGHGEAFNLCGPDNVRRQSLENVRSNPSLGFWATGVTVCNAEYGRMKGLRLRSTQFDYGPVLGNLISGESQHDQFTRPNCRDNWAADASCASGQVIVGVEVFYSREGGPEPDSIIGLKLYCRALAVRL